MDRTVSKNLNRMYDKGIMSRTTTRPTPGPKQAAQAMGFAKKQRTVGINYYGRDESLEAAKSAFPVLKIADGFV